MSETDLYTGELMTLSKQVTDFPRLDHPDVTIKVTSIICGATIELDAIFAKDSTIAQVGFDIDADIMAKAAMVIVAKECLHKNESLITIIHKQFEMFLKSDGPVPEWCGLEPFVALQDYPARHNAVLLSFKAIDAAFEKHRTEK